MTPEREKTLDERIQDAREYFHIAVLDTRRQWTVNDAIQVEVLLRGIDERTREMGKAKEEAVQSRLEADSMARALVVVRQEKIELVQRINAIDVKVTELERLSVERANELAALKEHATRLRETVFFANGIEAQRRLAAAEARVKELEAAREGTGPVRG